MSQNIFVKFFSSLRLTLFILFSIATTSIIGTLIPQELSEKEYTSYFNPFTFKILKFFNIFDMYYSWWFLSLLALLILNLIFCSLKHYKVTINRVFKDNVILDHNIEKSIINKKEITFKSKDFNLDKIESFINSNIGKVFKKSLLSNETHFFINKNRFSDLGYYVVHLSLIVIGIGAIVGGVYGYKGFMQLTVGETKKTVILKKGGLATLDFNVKCLDFKIDFYPNGAPKEYNSLIEITDGEKSFKTNVKVNHPLNYKGIKFFQSSYGTIPGKISIIAKKRSSQEEVFKNYINIGETIKLEDNLHFVIEDYSSNLQGFGPAVRLRLITDNVPGNSFLIFKNFPNFDEKHREGNYIFYFNDAKSTQYTGLQITKDPGDNIVWIGCILMMVGLYLSFFIHHKKFWLKISENSGKATLLFAGSTRKNRFTFEREFDEKFSKLENFLKN